MIGWFGTIAKWHPWIEKSEQRSEDEAAGAIRGIYEAGFDNLKTMFGE